MPGAVFPVDDGRLLLAMEDGFALFDPLTPGLIPLNLLRNSDKALRFNDGKCDPYGNIWIGTMHKGLAPNAGNLYRISKKGKVSAILGEPPSQMAWHGLRTTSDFIIQIPPPMSSGLLNMIQRPPVSRIKESVLKSLKPTGEQTGCASIPKGCSGLLTGAGIVSAGGIHIKGWFFRQ
jgi:hypothetical protein